LIVHYSQATQRLTGYSKPTSSFPVGTFSRSRAIDVALNWS
jgi:hypothetical protein